MQTKNDSGEDHVENESKIIIDHEKMRGEEKHLNIFFDSRFVPVPRFSLFIQTEHNFLHMFIRVLWSSISGCDRARVQTGGFDFISKTKWSEKKKHIREDHVENESKIIIDHEKMRGEEKHLNIFFDSRFYFPSVPTILSYLVVKWYCN